MEESFNWGCILKGTAKLQRFSFSSGKPSAVLCCVWAPSAVPSCYRLCHGVTAQAERAAGPCSSPGPCRARRFWLLLVARSSWWTTCVCCILPMLPSVPCSLPHFNTPPVWLAWAQEMLPSARAASWLSKVICLGWCVPPCTGFPAVECFMALWHLVNVCRGWSGKHFKLHFCLCKGVSAFPSDSANLTFV